MKRALVVVGVFSAALAIAWWILWPRPIARPDYNPRMASLRSRDYFVYPPRSAPVRGTILFFGNDVGFWQPHQELADFLSAKGYAVVGFDLRGLLKSNTDAPETSRDSAIAGAITNAMRDSELEFHAENLPLILMGHSLGAEVAIWSASRIRAPVISGVVAMAPGGRGHLEITPADLLTAALPQGPESFSMTDLVKSLPSGFRVALVRGATDGYRNADPAIISAGAGRVREFPIPFAGHSLKRILIARYVVKNALDWIAGGDKTQAGTAIELKAGTH